MIDPLDISGLSPWGEALHLQKSEDFYDIDGWLKNVTLSGLSDIRLDTVTVTRNADLTVLNVITKTELDLAQFEGEIL